jgi:hypothetical protein
VKPRCDTVAGLFGRRPLPLGFAAGATLAGSITIL